MKYKMMILAKKVFFDKIKQSEVLQQAYHEGLIRASERYCHCDVRDCLDHATFFAVPWNNVPQKLEELRQWRETQYKKSYSVDHIRFYIAHFVLIRPDRQLLEEAMNDGTLWFEEVRIARGRLAVAWCIKYRDTANIAKKTQYIPKIFTPDHLLEFPTRIRFPELSDLVDQGLVRETYISERGGKDTIVEVLHREVWWRVKEPTRDKIVGQDGKVRDSIIPQKYHPIYKKWYNLEAEEFFLRFIATDKILGWIEQGIVKYDNEHNSCILLHTHGYWLSYRIDKITEGFQPAAYWPLIYRESYRRQYGITLLKFDLVRFDVPEEQAKVLIELEEKGLLVEVHENVQRQFYKLITQHGVYVFYQFQKIPKFRSFQEARKYKREQRIGFIVAYDIAVQEREVAFAKLKQVEVVIHGEEDIIRLIDQYKDPSVVWILRQRLEQQVIYVGEVRNVSLEFDLLTLYAEENELGLKERRLRLGRGIKVIDKIFSLAGEDGFEVVVTHIGKGGHTRPVQVMESIIDIECNDGQGALICQNKQYEKIPNA